MVKCEKACFVKRVTNLKKQKGRKILKVMISFAKNLGIKTIAEYVENKKILNFLRRLC